MIEILAVHCFLLLGNEAPGYSKYVLRFNMFKGSWFAFWRKDPDCGFNTLFCLTFQIHALDFPLPLILTFVREIDCFNKILAEKEF